MAKFQIIVGRKEQPKDEWMVYTDFESGHPYKNEWDSPQEANEIVKRQNKLAHEMGASVIYMLKRMPDPVDFLSREATRQDYQPFEVQGEPLHCAELIEKSISFYNNLYDAFDNRRTEMKLGRYLRQYTSKDDNEISLICARNGIDCGDSVIKWARTREEIAEVYEKGPRSCMKGGRGNWFGTAHPAEAYASPDVAVAFIQRDDDRVTARTVVNIKDKTYVGVYGDSARLDPMLEAEGYKPDWQALRGCRLLKVPVGDGRYAVPYLDSNCCVAEHDETYLIANTEKGSWSGECGYVYACDVERESGQVHPSDSEEPEYDDYDYNDY